MLSSHACRSSKHCDLRVFALRSPARAPCNLPGRPHPRDVLFRLDLDHPRRRRVSALGHAVLGVVGPAYLGRHLEQQMTQRKKKTGKKNAEAVRVVYG